RDRQRASPPSRRTCSRLRREPRPPVALLVQTAVVGVAFVATRGEASSAAPGATGPAPGPAADARRRVRPLSEGSAKLGAIDAGARRVSAVEREQLQELQGPLKERYRTEPEAARITLSAEGTLGDGISCSVATGRALAEAGLHPATGGDGSLL